MFLHSNTPYISKNSEDQMQKHLYSLGIMGMAKRESWLRRVIMAGKVGYVLYSNGNLTPNLLRTEEARRMYADSFIAYLKKVEEQHEWDVNVSYKHIFDDMTGEYKTCYMLNIVLRFRKYTITNSNDKSRELRETFVIIPLMVTKIKDGKMVLRPHEPLGFRTALHIDEYNSGYIHSHLKSLLVGGSPSRIEASLKKARTFCIGSDHVEELMAILGANYDPHTFASYLIAITTMVTWESIEGVPYMYISSISSREARDDSEPVQSQSSYRNTMGKLLIDNSDDLSDFITDELDFTIRENHYEVKMTPEFESAIRTMLIDGEDHNFLVKKVGDKWLRFNATKAQHHIENANNDVFIFNGEELEPTLYGDGSEGQQNSENINEYRVFPKFLEYVTEQFNIQLFNYQISSSRTEAEN